MEKTLRTVIIPAAGMGTRLLPLTKSAPKELMPVYDRPVLQFAIEEAVAAGAERVIVITHRSKYAVEDYLSADHPIVSSLETQGKTDLVRLVRALAPPDAVEIVFAYQDEPLGLGHAILCAKDKALSGPIGIILPDDLVFGVSCLSEMAAQYRGGHMVAAMDVTLAEVSSYGIFAPIGDTHVQLVPVSGMVEKPAPARAPSHLAAVGRYILDPVIMLTLQTIPTGAGGELQLTDAIAMDAQKLPLWAFRFSGKRYDCGNHEGLFRAAMARRAEVNADQALLAVAAE